MIFFPKKSKTAVSDCHWIIGSFKIKLNEKNLQINSVIYFCIIIYFFFFLGLDILLLLLFLKSGNPLCIGRGGRERCIFGGGNKSVGFKKPIV